LRIISIEQAFDGKALDQIISKYHQTTFGCLRGSMRPNSCRVCEGVVDVREANPNPDP
jgi:hypothetical protein